MTDYGKIIHKDTGEVHSQIPILPDESCGTCRFWSCAVTRDRLRGFCSGSCVRHAPVRAPGAGPYDFIQTALWPNTVRTNWCGDWEYMNEKQEMAYLEERSQVTSDEEAETDG